MPKMKVFGRKWSIGSDDLVAPSLCGLLCRLVSLVVIAVAIALLQHQLFNSHYYVWISVYLYGYVLLSLVLIAAEFLIFYHSSRGGIMETERRSKVPLLVAVRAALYVPELLWAVFGTVLVVYEFPSDDVLWVVMVVWVSLYWLVFLFLFLVVLFIFDPLGSTPSDSEEYGSYASRIWRVRMCIMRILMLQRKGTQEFEDLARFLQEEFKHNDLVFSDITAGLILLYKHQAEQSNRHFSLDTACKFAVKTQFDHQLPFLTYYFKFASAAYGWPNYVWENTCRGLYNLCSPRCCCCRAKHPRLLDDSDCCCSFNYHSLLHKTGVRKEHFVLISFANKIQMVPFFVCLDHAQKNVVVAIRGTQSLADTMTDLLIEPVPIQHGYPATFLAHKGMLHAANYVSNTIHESGRLEEALNNYPEYGLVVTGHSLGAGVACLLSFILKTKLPSRKLSCYTYAPPGSILSIEAAELSTQFIFGAVLESDVTPRLSLDAYRLVESELLDQLRRCKRHKYSILFGGCYGVISYFLPRLGPDNAPSTDVLSEDVEAQRVLSDEACVTSDDSDHPLENAASPLVRKKILQSRRSSMACDIPLYPPGNFLYICPVETDRDSAAGAGAASVLDQSSASYISFARHARRYGQVWVEREYFHRIFITRRMLSSHLPYSMEHALAHLSAATAAAV